MNFGVVYLFNCLKCTLGTVSYIGTERMLRVRVAGYLGLSNRTGGSCGVKENSTIRQHARLPLVLRILIGSFND